MLLILTKHAPAAGNPSVLPNASLLREQGEVTHPGTWPANTSGNHQNPSLVTLTVQSTVHLLGKLKLDFEGSGSVWQLVSFILALQLGQVYLHAEGKKSQTERDRAQWGRARFRGVKSSLTQLGEQ